jgi:hypothetical protein
VKQKGGAKCGSQVHVIVSGSQTPWPLQFPQSAAAAEAASIAMSTMSTMSARIVKARCYALTPVVSNTNSAIRTPRLHAGHGRCADSEAQKLRASAGDGAHTSGNGRPQLLLPAGN